MWDEKSDNRSNFGNFDHRKETLKAEKTPENEEQWNSIHELIYQHKYQY